MFIQESQRKQCLLGAFAHYLACANTRQQIGIAGIGGVHSGHQPTRSVKVFLLHLYCKPAPPRLLQPPERMRFPEQTADLSRNPYLRSSFGPDARATCDR